MSSIPHKVKQSKPLGLDIDDKWSQPSVFENLLAKVCKVHVTLM